MAKGFKDRPTHEEDGAEILFNSRTDVVHDDPVFKPGDRVEFTVEYPGRGMEPVAAAGATATVRRINPTRDPSYSVRLDSAPDARWPIVVSGRYLAAEGSGVRGEQTTQTVLDRGSGELKRF